MFGAETAAVVFGLASALSWGGGDFCGGLATRRASVLSVIFIVDAFGVLLAMVLAFALSEPLLSPSELGWAAAAGLAGTVGLVSLYRGIAAGQTSVVAPVSSVVAAAVPAIISVLSEGAPGPLRLGGFALALLGIWLVSQGEGEQQTRGGLWLGLLAGLGFAGFYVFIHNASASATFWPLVAARGFVIPLLLATALVRRVSLIPPPSLLPLTLLSGVLDMGGNAMFVLASQAGRLDIAAVLSSLYPASTVVLARLVLGERISRPQTVGIVATLGAVALISA